MYRKLISILTAGTVTLGFSILAAADVTPEDAADYRLAIMTSLRGHVGAASMTVRGLVDDRGQLVNHAQGIANSVMELGNIFPEGSNIGDSEALPEIWEEPEDFAAAIMKVQDASLEFVEAAEGGDADTIRGAFRKLGGACRSCHDQFRIEHE